MTQIEIEHIRGILASLGCLQQFERNRKKYIDIVNRGEMYSSSNVYHFMSHFSTAGVSFPWARSSEGVAYWAQISTTIGIMMNIELAILAKRILLLMKHLHVYDKFMQSASLIHNVRYINENERIQAIASIIARQLAFTSSFRFCEYTPVLDKSFWSDKQKEFDKRYNVMQIQ